MSSSVVLQLDVDGETVLELTPAAAREVWEQLNKLFGDQQRLDSGPMSGLLGSA